MLFPPFFAQRPLTRDARFLPRQGSHLSRDAAAFQRHAATEEATGHAEVLHGCIWGCP